MSHIITTDYLDEQLLVDVSGPAFDPLIYGPLLSVRADKNAYQDAAQAVPAVAWGDVVRQVRDERELVGGALWPYLDQASAGLRPTLAPQFSAWGGLRLLNEGMDVAGLGAIDRNNCTLVITGVFTTDYTQGNNSQLIQKGTFAAGMILVGERGSMDPLPTPHISYNAADHVPAALRTNLGPYTVLTVQSSGTGVVLNANGVDSETFPAALTSSEPNGTVGYWVAPALQCFGTWIARVLVYSPALSTPQLRTLQSGLNGAGLLGSITPLSWPLLAWGGNSIVNPVSIGVITPSQTWPYVLMASLTDPVGYLIGAWIGAPTALLSSTVAPGLGSHWQPNRTASTFFFLQELTNSINNGGTISSVLADVRAYRAALANGYRGTLCLLTCLPSTVLSGAKEVVRLAVNAALRADFPAATGQGLVTSAGTGIGYADLLYDCASEPDLADPTNVLWYSDGVHPTAAGLAVLAAGGKRAVSLRAIA